MPNGKPGDHPLTDWLLYGEHPFPQDMEQMLAEAQHLRPKWHRELPPAEELAWNKRFFDWESGKNLDEGRAALRELLERLRNQQLGT